VTCSAIHDRVHVSINEKLTVVLTGVFALLVLSSVVTWILHNRLATGQPNQKIIATIDNLTARVKAWWVMAAVLAISFLLGTTATLLVFATGSFMALREFLRLTQTWPEDHAALAVAFFLVLPFQYLLIGIQWYGLFAIMIPVYAFLILPIFPAIRHETTHFLERTARLQWGLMLTVYCISHAPALLLLTIPNYTKQNALLLFYLVFITQVSDVLQYVFGKLFGRTSIAPAISPSKTVEGLIGGGISAILCGTSLWWITPFTPIQALGFAALIVVFGFAGGLVLSAVKRSLGVKDWGSAIAGHGGALDRLDSLSFSAPIFFHLVRYFFSV
jgi:phosphatidate cytidylyltransferase